MEAIWIWAIIGILLVSIEIFTVSFYILSFGISALLVTVILSLVDLSANVQLVLFITFSIAVLSLLHFKYKGNRKTFLIGQSSDDTIGKIGKISDLSEDIATVKFNIPVMGSRTWMAISDDQLDIGDSVKVISIEGNYLRVKKVS